MAYPDALPHDPPRQIAEDLFVVYGSVKMLPGVSVTRNMAIVRQGGELTLINPVRMNEAGLASIEALGKVSHVLRLGPLHGMDEAFYLERYKPRFWAFADNVHYPLPSVAEALNEGGPLPFAQASLFVFRHMKETEGAIVLDRAGGNILLTCDAIQSYSTPPHMPYTASLTQKLFSLLGFTRHTLIGPIWIKKLVSDRQGIRGEFERLLQYEFEQLLSSHGTFVEKNARAELQQAFERMFP